MVHLQPRKCRNEILQIKFDIVVRLIHLLYTHHIPFALLEPHFYFFDRKRVDCAKNAAFDFPSLIEHQTKTIANDGTKILTNKIYYISSQNKLKLCDLGLKLE